MTGIEMVHIPYRGDVEAITDLLGGRLQVYFGTLPGSIDFIRGEKLRALAVTTVSRSPALPDVASLAEFLPGYEATIWNGLNAPKGTPAAIVASAESRCQRGIGQSRPRRPLRRIGCHRLPGVAGRV
jgi:tripartite-type tricarboxylate transporter receptor subunit TctC